MSVLLIFFSAIMVAVLSFPALVGGYYRTSQVILLGSGSVALVCVGIMIVGGFL